MNERHQALEHIKNLAQQHNLSTQEVIAALVSDEPDSSAASGLLIKVLSYVGGIFVFAGIAIFIALQWDGMNSAARIVITLGTGVAFFTAAVAALKDDRYQALAAPLLLVSGVLQPTGLMVVFAELGSGGDEQVAALITAVTFAAQYGFAMLKWRQTLMAGLCLFFGSAAWGLGLDLMDFDFALIALTLGISWLCFGTANLSGRYAALAPQLLFIGCWAFLAGVFDMVEDSVLEVLFVLATCGMIYLGVWAKSRALNLASTAALLAYTAYFTGHYFADSIGWPIALIVIGLAMMAISTFAVRIDRRLRRA